MAVGLGYASSFDKATPKLISSSRAPLAMGLIPKSVNRRHVAGVGRRSVGSATATPAQSAQARDVTTRKLPSRLPAKQASPGLRSGSRGVGQARSSGTSSGRAARKKEPMHKEKAKRKPIHKQEHKRKPMHTGKPTAVERSAKGKTTTAVKGSVKGKPTAVKRSVAPKLVWGTSGLMHMASAHRHHLDTWGPSFSKRLEEARRRWFEQNQRARVGVSGCQTKVKIGTDCSGAEAPIWAMKQMQYPHEHVFSCDWQSSVRTFIRATCPPTGPIFEDMLTRDHTKLPHMDVYVCGFPCTPFSALRHHKSRLLREAAAKPFFEVLAVLRKNQPKLAVLENVIGIRQVMGKILRYLRGLKIYWIIVLPIDAQDLGEPVARPRYYFLLVRRGVGVLKSVESIKSLVTAMAHAAHEPATSHVASRMLLSDSPCVRQYLQFLNAREEQVSTKRCKWPDDHEAYRAAKRLRRMGSDSSGLPTQRMRSAYSLLKQHAGQDIIGDFSQSIGRINARTDGVSPTVTPNAMIHVDGRGVGRVVTPREKLLLHLFPLHKMAVPQDFPEEDLGAMGGNTMHLKAVGLALTIGLALTDFSCTASSTSEASAPAVIELPLNTVRSGRS